MKGLTVSCVFLELTKRHSSPEYNGRQSAGDVLDPDATAMCSWDHWLLQQRRQPLLGLDMLAMHHDICPRLLPLPEESVIAAGMVKCCSAMPRQAI